MCYDELRATEPLAEETVQSKLTDYRFLNYASQFWYIHARNSSAWSQKLIQLANRFFQPKESRWLLWSRVFESSDAAKRISRKPEKLSPLYYASLLGLIQPLRWLQKQDLDCNKTEMTLNDALRAGSCQGHFDIVDFLITHGAEVNARSQMGTTALHLAAENGHAEVVKLLIDQGAEVKTQDQDGWTALHRAAKNGHSEVVKLLIGQGADIDQKDEFDKTPMHVAIYSGSTQNRDDFHRL